MSVVAEDKQYRLDWLKWLVVLTLLGGAIYANWYYSAESALYRIVGFLVVQLVEHRSPKPAVGGSSPSWPATLMSENG